MDDKKIAVIVHSATGKFSVDFTSAICNISVPDGYSLKLLAKVGNKKYTNYNSLMQSSDAKYKIYIDENAIIVNENFLNDIIKIFESDKNIGIIGCSGAIKFSTHGVCLNSAKRCGKILTGGGGAVI